MSGPVAPVPTPLLDAALKRAEAVEQAYRQAIATRELPPSTEVASQPDMPSKVLAAGPRKSAKDDKEPVRTFKLSSSGRRVSTPSDAGLKPRSEPPRTTAPRADPASRSGSGDVATVPPVRSQVVEWLASETLRPANQALLRRAVASMADATTTPAVDATTRSAEIRSAVLALEDRVPLSVTELRLCRKVLGFGAFEPPTVRAQGGTAGHRLLRAVRPALPDRRPELRFPAVVAGRARDGQRRREGLGSVAGRSGRPMPEPAPRLLCELPDHHPHHRASGRLSHPV